MERTEGYEINKVDIVNGPKEEDGEKEREGKTRSCQ